MIHYFNPGHETAILNASKYYHPPAHVKKMQTDLAFLPAWYANNGDFVLMENSLTDDFKKSFDLLNFTVNPVSIIDLASNKELYKDSEIKLWGISPQSVHFFENINKQYDLSLVIPQWKDEFCFLGSRFASHKILASLLNRIPGIEKEILPRFFSVVESIEQETVKSSDILLAKSPYSSSGRGLVWLPPGKIAQSEKQILSGMIKRQMQVSIEKGLDKYLDFSMQFENNDKGETHFTGYSIFQTNEKGAYQKSMVADQDSLQKQLTNYIDYELLLRTKKVVSEMIKEIYAPFYTGFIGVDMLIYKSCNSYYLHPCVEINMRNNMGNIAICLAEKYLHHNSTGEFYTCYNNSTLNVIGFHKQMQKKHPLIIEKGRIRSGYLSLCPITDITNYQAYIIFQEVNCAGLEPATPTLSR